MFDEGKRAVYVCSGAECQGRRGSEKIYEAFRQRIAERGLTDEIELGYMQCLRMCSMGPNVMSFPRGSLYSNVVDTSVDEILSDVCTPEDNSR